jgi:outer membrane autotransporter protein
MIKPSAWSPLIKVRKNPFYYLVALLLCLPQTLFAASVTPTSVDFGDVRIDQGTDDSSNIVTINVSLDSSDTGRSVSIGSPNNPFSIYSNDCPSFVESPTSCSVQVIFEPTAAGSYTGSFDVIAGNTTTVSLTGTGSTLLTEFSNENPNIIATSSVIYNACTSGNVTAALQRDCDALIDSASQDDPATSTALAQIMPETATNANQTTQQGRAAQTRNINSRIAALRSGTSGISVTGLSFQIEDNYLPIGDLAQSSLRAKGGGASADENLLLGQKLGAFITGVVSTGDRDESSLESGHDFDTYGITAGVDYRISDNFFLGIALGYLNTDTRFSNNDAKLDTQGYSLGVYGSYYTDNDYYIDFSATYGKNDFNQSRRLSYQLVNTTSVNQEFTADYSGDVYSLLLGLGRDYNKGAWSFGPRINLEYTLVHANQITEQASNPSAAGSGWATQINSTDQEGLTLLLGGSVSYAQSTQWGVLIPYAQLDFLHEFMQDSQNITGSFIGDFSSNQLQITTDNPDRNYMMLSLGTSAQFKHGVSGFLSYSTLLSNNVWNENTIRIGMRGEF